MWNEKDGAKEWERNELWQYLIDKYICWCYTFWKAEADCVAKDTNKKKSQNSNFMTVYCVQSAKCQLMNVNEFFVVVRPKMNKIFYYFIRGIDGENGTEHTKKNQENQLFCKRNSFYFFTFDLHCNQLLCVHWFSLTIHFSFRSTLKEIDAFFFSFPNSFSIRTKVLPSFSIQKTFFNIIAEVVQSDVVVFWQLYFFSCKSYS